MPKIDDLNEQRLETKIYDLLQLECFQYFPETLDFGDIISGHFGPKYNFFNHLNDLLADNLTNPGDDASLPPYHWLNNYEKAHILAKALKRAWNEKGYPLSPLHYAAASGDLAAVKGLKILGFRSDEKDARGCTALHYAAFSGNYDLIHLLIVQHGLKPKEEDIQGQTLLDWIYKSNRKLSPQVVALCEDQAALEALRQKHLAILAAIENETPKELAPTVIKHLIAEYVMPGDAVFMKIRLQQKIARLEQQKQGFFGFYHLILAYWLALTLISIAMLALSLLITFMISPFVGLPLLAYSCLVYIFPRVINFLEWQRNLSPCMDEISKEKPLSTGYFLHLFKACETLKEDNEKRWHTIHYHGYREPDLRLPYVGHVELAKACSIITLSFGLFFLCYLSLAGLSLALGIAALSIGVAHTGLEILGFFKVNKQVQRMNNETMQIEAMPVY